MAFSDDFNDGIINPNWTTNTPVGTITESGGKLNISIGSGQDGSWWSGSVEYAPIIYSPKPSGSFEYTVKITSLSYSTQSMEAGLILYKNRDNVYQFSARNDGSQKIEIDKIVGDRGSVVTSTGNSTIPLWLKIRYDGTTYYFDYSTDNENWTNLYSTSSLGFIPDYIGLQAAKWNTSTSMNVSFDDFIVDHYLNVKTTITINQERYTDWLWQNEIEITGSVDGQLTNYPVLITVPYDNEFMRTDFQDIRFGTDYGLNLPFFLRRKVDNDFAEFFVKIPVIPASPDTITIYIYAGNDQAPDRSDIYNTFPFGDHFDEKYAPGLDSSKWTSSTSGVGSSATLTGGALVLSSTAYPSGVAVKSIPTFGENYILGMRVKTSAMGGGDAQFGFNNSANRYIVEKLTSATSKFLVNDAGGEDTGDDHRGSYDPTQYHVYEFQNKPTGGIREYIDFTEVDSSDVNITTALPVYLQQYRAYNYNLFTYIDYVYVRPSIDNEPAIGELDVWATTTHTDIYQALLTIPYFSDIQALFCIRPLREDFQALIHITGSGEELIKALITINARNQANYINYVQALLTINANAKNKDIQTLINIGKVLYGSIELKGRILYNYNRDETTIPEENTSKQFVMKLGGRIYG